MDFFGAQDSARRKTWQLVVLFGASQSFLTPMGYQTNLMVFGPGRYQFLDVPRYGAGLTLLMTLLVPALILRQYGAA